MFDRRRRIEVTTERNSCHTSQFAPATVVERCRRSARDGCRTFLFKPSALGPIFRIENALPIRVAPAGSADQEFVVFTAQQARAKNHEQGNPIGQTGLSNKGLGQGATKKFDHSFCYALYFAQRGVLSLQS